MTNGQRSTSMAILRLCGVLLVAAVLAAPGPAALASVITAFGGASGPGLDSMSFNNLGTPAMGNDDVVGVSPNWVSINQKAYIDSIRKFDIVFGIGPAGTGKTYLAMAMAVSALVKKELKRVVLARPAVEAGERLGFLPGDLYEKVNPYLRPLYDALHDMMDFDSASQMIQRGVIEVAPLAFMRGRTLNDSFVILDEAQNATTEQMKMFLTRLGFSSKAVITGDVTQTDLPEGKTSGLIEARKLLKNIQGIHFSYFTRDDVIRHPLVQEIIDAYDKAERTPKTSEEGQK